MRRQEPSDEERSIIQPLLPQKSRGVPRVDDRPVIGGFPRQSRTGGARRDAPERRGAAHDALQSVRAVAGGWGRDPEAIHEAHDGDIAMIDGSCVRVPRHGTAANGHGRMGTFAWGHSHGGLSTGMHALVDAAGPSMRLP